MPSPSFTSEDGVGRYHLSLGLTKTGPNLLFFFLMFLYYAVLISGIQQSESIIHMHVSILLQILFLFRLLQSIE